ncbi:preprotein translocase subunit Sec61beta [Candidatus Woesearchaeota archaeon]|jgi:preprotein translocase subunit Sec61beta|nr:MAG: preprotein translocase subunit Sec61beta [Candidatus Woesearchaeota archaeon]
MAKDNKIRLPSGMGGLTSYDEATGSFIKLTPLQVILLGAGIAIIIILLEVGLL